MMHWGNVGWGMQFGWIYMLLFWVIVFAAIAYLVRSLSHRQDCGYHEAPIDILKRRYSKGELTKDEYDRLKDDLKKS